MLLIAFLLRATLANVLPPASCSTFEWGMGSQWQGYFGLTQLLKTVAMECCFPPVARVPPLEQICRHNLKTGNIIDTFVVRTEGPSPIRRWPGPEDYNVKVGVVLESGLRGMLRLSRRGAPADYLAYLISLSLDLDAVPVVELRRVDADWFMSLLKNRTYMPDSESHRESFFSEFVAPSVSNGSLWVSIQLWIQGAVLYHGEDGLPFTWLQAMKRPSRSSRLPSHWTDRLLELSDLALFDFIISNKDRFHSVSEDGVYDLTKHKIFRPLDKCKRTACTDYEHPLQHSGPNTPQPEGTVNSSMPSNINITMKQRDNARKREMVRSVLNSLSRLLNSYNIFTYFPSGPMLYIDQSDAFLNLTNNSPLSSAHERVSSPGGNFFYDICFFRNSTVAKVMQAAEKDPFEWIQAIFCVPNTPVKGHSSPFCQGRWQNKTPNSDSNPDHLQATPEGGDLDAARKLVVNHYGMPSLLGLHRRIQAARTHILNCLEKFNSDEILI